MDIVLQQHVGTSISHNNTNRGPGGGTVYSNLLACVFLLVRCLCMYIELWPTLNTCMLACVQRNARMTALELVSIRWHLLA